MWVITRRITWDDLLMCLSRVSSLVLSLSRNPLPFGLPQELDEIRKSGIKVFREIAVDESNILSWQGLIVPVSLCDVVCSVCVSTRTHVYVTTSTYVLVYDRVGILTKWEVGGKTDKYNFENYVLFSSII